MRAGPVTIYWNEDWIFWILAAIFLATAGGCLWLAWHVTVIRQTPLLFWFAIIWGFGTPIFVAWMFVQAFRAISWMKPCPRCGKRMQRFPTPRGGGRIYQVCTACHIKVYTGASIEGLQPSRSTPSLGAQMLDSLRDDERS